jgi:hypothetical protein
MARHPDPESNHCRLFAFDFDGTLAESGVVPSSLQIALERLQSSGCKLFLVTGRRFESIELGPLRDCFSGIVWENGGVLYHTATREVYLPFGCVNPHLVEALEAAHVPLEYGQAIVATRTPHDETVWHVLNEWGGDASVVHNKGAIMILPPGVSKGTGLERLLHLCGFSPRNLVTFGDGENDQALLQLGEIGVAVADAVPTLKQIADVVTTRPGPAGVMESLETCWLPGSQRECPVQHVPRIPLGEDEAGEPVSIAGAVLASGNVGVFGDSSSGKSWVTGLLAEGMHHAGYQVLLIDVEGDFKGLQALPRFVVFEGDLKTFPSPALIAHLLETVMVSVVLDLSAYLVSRRENLVAELLHALHSLKERKFRPHWIVLEEAQSLLPPGSSAVSRVLSPMLHRGGFAFVTYQPDRLLASVLDTLDFCFLTRLSRPEAIQAISHTVDLRGQSPALIPQGYVWLCRETLTPFLPNIRRVPHIRHLYKYLTAPLPAHKRFRFRDAQDFLGLEAASLFEFLQLLSTLPIESLEYHHRRGDFVAWVEGALGDSILAAHLAKLFHRELEGEALREALMQRVAAHYKDLEALH